jgi:hypothetical protein
MTCNNGNVAFHDEPIQQQPTNFIARHTMRILILTLTLTLLCTLTLPTLAGATGNISLTDKYAWSETSGWQNFASTDGGVTVYDDHLEGYTWAENIGWIKLGSFSGGGTHTYTNTDNSNWGVNRSGSNLTGYAWSENAGWIKLNPSGGGVTLDAVSGFLDGWAWGENIGWVHFRNTSPSYGVAVHTYLLSLIFSGSGSGNITSTPTGMDCSSNCNYTFLSGTAVMLTAATSTPQSTFTGWIPSPAIDGCLGVTPCLLAMTTDKAVIVKFDLGPSNAGPLARTITTGYNSINDAYSAAGSNDTIFAVTGTHNSLVLDKIKSVTLKGGYDIDSGFNYTTQSDYSTISDLLTISSGTVKTERIKIKSSTP